MFVLDEAKSEAVIVERELTGSELPSNLILYMLSLVMLSRQNRQEGLLAKAKHES